MQSLFDWISGAELMKRWGTDNEIAVFDAIRRGLWVGEGESGFPGEVFHIDNEDAIEWLQLNGSGVTKPLTIEALRFRRVDVEAYEAELHDDEKLDKRGVAELMRLKRSNAILKAEVDAGIHMAFFAAARLEAGKKITRDEFINEGLKSFSGRLTENYLKRTLWPKFQQYMTSAKEAEAKK